MLILDCLKLKIIKKKKKNTVFSGVLFDRSRSRDSPEYNTVGSRSHSPVGRSINAPQGTYAN